jgi:negative regulator of flagellin synthesis FlgM
MTRKGANMVDPLGTKPVKTSERMITPVARVAPATPVTPVTPRVLDSVSPSAIASTASNFAATPPINHERVAQIRKAIAEGNFPILPAEIADRLIAAKMDWLRNDPE